MRYKGNDIDLSYQKDRNCDSLKINTLYGVIDTPFSNKLFIYSFKEIFNSQKYNIKKLSLIQKQDNSLSILIAVLNMG